MTHVVVGLKLSKFTAGWGRGGGGGRKGKIVELFGLVRHSSKEEKEYVTNPTGVCIGG